MLQFQSADEEDTDIFSQSTSGKYERTNSNNTTASISLNGSPTNRNNYKKATLSAPSSRPSQYRQSSNVDATCTSSTDSQGNNNGVGNGNSDSKTNSNSSFDISDDMYTSRINRNKIIAQNHEIPSRSVQQNHCYDTRNGDNERRYNDDNNYGDNKRNYDDENHSKSVNNENKISRYDISKNNTIINEKNPCNIVVDDNNHIHNIHDTDIHDTNIRDTNIRDTDVRVTHDKEKIERERDEREKNGLKDSLAVMKVLYVYVDIYVYTYTYM